MGGFCQLEVVLLYDPLPFPRELLLFDWSFELPLLQRDVSSLRQICIRFDENLLGVSVRTPSKIPSTMLHTGLVFHVS